MTIAAVPPTGIDVARVAPGGEAAAGGFDELLAGAQAKAPEEQAPEPVRGTDTKRPVRAASRDASKTTKDATDVDATDADATDAADTGERTVDAPTEGGEADAGDGALVAPIVVASVLPDSGVGQIVLDALAELEGTVEGGPDVSVVVAAATVADVVTTTLPVAAAVAPETAAAPPTAGTDDVASTDEPVAAEETVAPETPSVVAEEPPVVDEPANTRPHAAPGATKHPADAIATTVTDAAPARDAADVPAAPAPHDVRPAPAPPAPVGAAAVDAEPVAPTTAPAPAPTITDDRVGRSEHASPIAVSAVAGRDMPAVSRGAEVSAAHTANAPASAPPAEQLVSVLRPLRTAPDGSYRIRLELRPPELGRVELRVEMRDGVLSASLHTDNEGAATTLQNALGELRARLEATGVRAGSLSVDDGRAGTDRQAHRDAPRERGNQGISDTTTAAQPAATPAPGADDGLDVRL
jgi:flagellar hook-length control protein FliK